MRVSTCKMCWTNIMSRISARSISMSSYFGFSLRNITLSGSDPEMPWTLDGEYQAGSAEIHVKNVHNAAKILL